MRYIVAAALIFSLAGCSEPKTEADAQTPLSVIPGLLNETRENDASPEQGFIYFFNVAALSQTSPPTTLGIAEKVLDSANSDREKLAAQFARFNKNEAALRALFPLEESIGVPWSSVRSVTHVMVDGSKHVKVITTAEPAASRVEQALA